MYISSRFCLIILTNTFGTMLNDVVVPRTLVLFLIWKACLWYLTTHPAWFLMAAVN